MKKILKIFLCVFLAGVFVIVASCSFIYGYSRLYSIPEQDEHIENTTGLVQAHNRSLYDAQGNKIRLIGVNLGQLYIQEGWMGPFALEPLKNEDGSYVKDGGNNIQYPEFTEEHFREGLKSNPNLKDYDIDELLDIYYRSFFDESDADIIKNELGMNAIRLPIYYLNIVNEDLTLKSEEEAFSHIDYIIELAASQEIYIILDLHSAPGSQNGLEHSGFIDREAKLWNSEENRAATLAIWDFMSEHYTTTRPDLGKWIATYDILNEPTYEYNGVTTKECWDFFDEIYDTIRENNDNHVITMEGCWGYSYLPDPKDYNWENVQYEYHWYNWTPDQFPYWLMYVMNDMQNIGRDYNVPVLLGEFTCFEDKEAWATMLELFDERNYSWTVWSYKTVVTGWWTSSWGVYTTQLKFITENEDLKCNVATCTYDEFIEVCSKLSTKDAKTGTLYKVIKDYMAKQ